MTYEEIKRRLSELDTACVCDADKERRVLRVMDPALRPVQPGLKLIGRAHTVRCHEDFLTVIKGLRDAEPGEAIVIDSQGSHRALTGGLFPTEAHRKGLTGIVIDGPCRDTAAIRHLNMPYYARSVSCRAGTATQIFETQVPVNCGGVTVNPGDILFGDDDGLIVATLDEVRPLIKAAEEIKQKEKRLVQRMAAGVSLLEMLNFEEHCENISTGRKSRLQFLV